MVGVFISNHCLWFEISRPVSLLFVCCVIEVNHFRGNIHLEPLAFGLSEHISSVYRMSVVHFECLYDLLCVTSWPTHQPISFIPEKIILWGKRFFYQVNPFWCNRVFEHLCLHAQKLLHGKKICCLTKKRHIMVPNNCVNLHLSVKRRQSASTSHPGRSVCL